MHARTFTMLGCLFPLTLAAFPAAAEEMDHSAHAGQTHDMSAEDLATLRSKIPLYQSLTDAQINESMGRMSDTEAYLSPPGVNGSVGVLALGHGYGDKGNDQFKAAFSRVAGRQPTAVGLGMAMMDSSHIQRAVDKLEAAGAKTIVVLPVEIGETSNLTRQWDYILGRDDRSAYLDVPRVKSNARIVRGRSPTASDVVTDILVGNLRSISRTPAKEVAIVVAHGPTDEQENRRQLEMLERHARGIKARLGFADVMVTTLQDDAPTAIRDANVAKLRARLSAATQSGKRVLVTPILMTGGGFVSGKIRRDLAGLEFEMADSGLSESPLFGNWIDQAVADSVKP